MSDDMIEANADFDDEGLLVRIGDWDLMQQPLDLRREATELYRKLAAIEGEQCTRPQVAFLIAGRCIAAEALGFPIASAVVSRDGEVEIHSTLNAPIFPSEPLELMRVTLLSMSANAAELAADFGDAGLDSDADMVIGQYQLSALAAALDASDRVISLKTMVIFGVAGMLKAHFSAEQRALAAALIERERLDGDDLAGFLAPVRAMCAAGGTFAEALLKHIGVRLRDIPDDNAQSGRHIDRLFAENMVKLRAIDNVDGLQ